MYMFKSFWIVANVSNWFLCVAHICIILYHFKYSASERTWRPFPSATDHFNEKSEEDLNENFLGEKMKKEIYVCNMFHSVTTTDETFCSSTQWCEIFMYGNLFTETS